ncbi:MAG TPA: hypothetical protein P5087_05935 [Eubacteriales bacterium]|nr:hypothetical protein [Eubacteriales bacterium]
MKKKLMKKNIGELFNSLEFSAIWVLVVVPALSLILISISGESPLYTSLSRIAWVSGYRLFMLFWSLIIIFPMVCLTIKVFRESPISEKNKKGLTIVAIVNIIVSFVSGLIIPAKNGVDPTTFWGKMHDILTALGWLSYGIALTAFSITLTVKDRTRGIVDMAFMAFIWLTGIFFIFKVIDENTYCGASAITQVYIINMLNIFLLLNVIYQNAENKKSIPETQS